jgi:hypothetical protein
MGLASSRGPLGPSRHNVILFAPAGKVHPETIFHEIGGHVASGNAQEVSRFKKIFHPASWNQQLFFRQEPTVKMIYDHNKQFLKPTQNDISEFGKLVASKDPNMFRYLLKDQEILARVQSHRIRSALAPHVDEGSTKWLNIFTPEY